MSTFQNAPSVQQIAAQTQEVSPSFTHFQAAAENFTWEDQHELQRIDHQLANEECTEKILLHQRRAELLHHQTQLREAFERWLADTFDKFENEPDRQDGRAYHIYLGKKQAKINAEAREKGSKEIIDQDLEIAGIANLLTAPLGERIKIRHLSDTIDDHDLAKERIALHSELLGDWLEVEFDDRYQSSEPGRSLHTGTHALQLIGQHIDLAAKHGIAGAPITILINNADRSKHQHKEKAAGSQCLWARVKDPVNGTLHNIVGVDHEAFAPLKPWIEELYVIEGIIDDPEYSDLSQGSQFRSLEYFPYAQALLAIARTGAPAGFSTKKLPLSTLPDLEIDENEALLGDFDRFTNLKLLSGHSEGIKGICEKLNTGLDKEQLRVTFYHPDTNQKIYQNYFMPTEFLGKHTGLPCTWNGSSRTPSRHPLIEIGISKSFPEQVIKELANIPIGTKLVFEKDDRLSTKIGRLIAKITPDFLKHREVA